MTISNSITFTKPTADTEFYHSAGVSKEFVEQYTAAGKILSSVVTLSEDGLSRTVTRTFASEEAMAEFKNDPARQEHLTARNKYNTTNRIAVDHT
jgi:hypothetical protein